jgi:hypothetical protein
MLLSVPELFPCLSFQILTATAHNDWTAVLRLAPRLAVNSHQPPSLLFIGWLSAELPADLQFSYFTSLHSTDHNNSDTSILQFNSSAPKFISWQAGVSKLNWHFTISSRSSSTAISRDSLSSISALESELLYYWGFTANQFVLATSHLRLTTSVF